MRTLIDEVVNLKGYYSFVVNGFMYTDLRMF